MANWLKISRPGTLFAAISPVVAALCCIDQGTDINITTAAVTLLAAMAIQILSNFVNDYFDYKRGSDGAERLGPVRAISKGLVTAHQMKCAIALVAAVAIVLGAYLIWVGGWPIALIGISALVFACLYSIGRYSLSHLGIADIFVFIYFGPVASLGTYYLQMMSASASAFWVGCATGLISMAVLTVNNRRDAEQDRLHGKKTIVVRLGNRFAAIYYSLLILAPIAILGLVVKSWLSLIVIPYAIALIWMFWTYKGRQFNKLLIVTGLYNVVWTIAFIFLTLP